MNPTTETAAPTWAAAEPFDVGDDRLAWCEHFESHFWDVGGAADMLGRQYTGWYLEDDGMSGETAVGVVLEAKGEAGEDTGTYHAAILDPLNEGAAMVSIETFTEAMEAAHRADALAEQYADSERDYRAAWSAATLAADTFHELSELREDMAGLDPERPVGKAVHAELDRKVRTIRGAGDRRDRNPEAFDDTFAQETGQSYEDALDYVKIIEKERTT